MVKFREMVWHPQSYVTEIPENNKVVRVLKDYWWIVDADGNIAFYENRNPQCSVDENIAKRYVKPSFNARAVGIELIPLAFVPIKISDYCD